MNLSLRSYNEQRLWLMSGDKMGVKQKMVETLMLPKDLMLGAAVITVTGQLEAYIENYRGILEYTEENIKLQTKTCILEIQGRSLSIAFYTSEEMKITGFISRIEYH